MTYGIGSKDSKSIGNGYSVITAESGSVGGYHAVFYLKPQTVCGKIYIAVRLLLADHIHVSLKDDRLFPFASG